jgi:hypothetical protein
LGRNAYVERSVRTQSIHTHCVDLELSDVTISCASPDLEAVRDTDNDCVGA